MDPFDPSKLSTLKKKKGRSHSSRFQRIPVGGDGRSMEVRNQGWAGDTSMSVDSVLSSRSRMMENRSSVNESAGRIGKKQPTSSSGIVCISLLLLLTMVSKKYVRCHVRSASKCALGFFEFISTYKQYFT